MQIAGAPSIVTDPAIEMLKMMSDPVKFKAHVKTLEDATRKFNKARKEHDDVMQIAKTVEQANEYVAEREKAIKELETRRNKVDEARKRELSALEISIGRREGAHQTVVKEHEQANTAVRNELGTLTRSLATREGILERGKKQLAQDSAALKLAQDGLRERQTRLAQALKS